MNTELLPKLEEAQKTLAKVIEETKTFGNKLYNAWEKFMNSHLNVKYALSAVASAA